MTSEHPYHEGVVGPSAQETLIPLKKTGDEAKMLVPTSIYISKMKEHQMSENTYNSDKSSDCCNRVTFNGISKICWYWSIRLVVISICSSIVRISDCCKNCLAC